MEPVTAPPILSPHGEDVKILYLAGPVSGRLDTAKLEFAAAELGLSRAGYLVINPLKTANNPKAEEREFGRHAAGKPQWCRVMRRCLGDMMECDGLATMPGWTHSRGARLEVHVARELGMAIKEAGEWLRLRPA